MTPPVVMAFGAPQLTESSSGPLWACRFELLPGGTMFNAPCTLRGVIVTPAVHAVDDGCTGLMVAETGGPVEIYATDGTLPQELEPHAEALSSHLLELLEWLNLVDGVVSGELPSG